MHYEYEIVDHVAILIAININIKVAILICNAIAILMSWTPLYDWLSLQSNHFTMISL